MVAPLIIAGVLAAGTALAGWLNSREAANASKEERQRISDLVKKLRAPNFDPTTIKPEEYTVVEKYVPQVSSYVAEAAPQLVEGKGPDRTLSREVMREAIAKLRDEAQNGTSGKLAVNEALDQAGAAMRTQDASLAQEFAMRGSGASGPEAMARLMQAQRGQGVLADTTRRAKLDSLRSQIEDLKAAAGMASQMGAEELNLESQNAGITNNFNARMADSRRTWQYNKDNAVNRAMEQNVGIANDTANRNVDLRNTYRQNQQNRSDKIVQAGYDFEKDKLGFESGVSNQARADIAAGAKQTQGVISGIGDAGQTINARANMPSQNQSSGQSTPNKSDGAYSPYGATDPDYEEYLRSRKAYNSGLDRRVV